MTRQTLGWQARAVGMLVAFAVLNCAGLCTALMCEPPVPAESASHETPCHGDESAPVPHENPSASCEEPASKQTVPKKAGSGDDGVASYAAIVDELTLHPNHSRPAISLPPPDPTSTEKAIRTTVLTL